jgi:hypothetical protein
MLKNQLNNAIKHASKYITDGNNVLYFDKENQRLGSYRADSTLVLRNVEMGLATGYYDTAWFKSLTSLIEKNSELDFSDDSVTVSNGKLKTNFKTNQLSEDTITSYRTEETEYETHLEVTVSDLKNWLDSAINYLDTKSSNSDLILTSNYLVAHDTINLYIANLELADPNNLPDIANQEHLAIVNPTTADSILDLLNCADKEDSVKITFLSRTVVFEIQECTLTLTKVNKDDNLPNMLINFVKTGLASAKLADCCPDSLFAFADQAIKVGTLDSPVFTLDNGNLTNREKTLSANDSDIECLGKFTVNAKYIAKCKKQADSVEISTSGVDNIDTLYFVNHSQSSVIVTKTIMSH